MTDDHEEMDPAATNGQDDSRKAMRNVDGQEASCGINDFGRGKRKSLRVFNRLERLAESELTVHNNKI